MNKTLVIAKYKENIEWCYNLKDYFNRNKNDEYFKSINEKYGGIPNGELFPHIFEYFWNLLFNQHRIIET